MKKRAVLVAVLGSALAVFMAGTAMAGPSTDHSPLTAQIGEGNGQVTIATTPVDQGTFVAQVSANVQGTSPNTLFSLQRAVDPAGDGTCDALGAYEEQGTFTTSPGGSGALHVERHQPVPSGLTVDVVERAVGADGTILISECMTVTIQ
jgi:hypothetical protein